MAINCRQPNLPHGSKLQGGPKSHGLKLLAVLAQDVKLGPSTSETKNLAVLVKTKNLAVHVKDVKPGRPRPKTLN